MNIDRLYDDEELEKLAFGVSSTKVKKKLKRKKYFEDDDLDFYQKIEIIKKIQNVIGFKLETKTFIARKFYDEAVNNLRNEEGTVSLFCSVGTPLHVKKGICCFFVYSNKGHDTVVTVDLRLHSQGFKNANIQITVDDLRKNKWRPEIKRACSIMIRRNREDCKEKPCVA